MSRQTLKRGLRPGLAALLIAGMVAGCDYADPIESDPNAVPDAGLDQLFTGIQVNSFFFRESQISRITSMWTQQMAGTTRQFQTLDQYVITEREADDVWDRVYRQGGLLDIRNAKALAEEQGRRIYAGILKIHEAYLIGMAASIWGDIPYSQAGLPEQFSTPKLDDQLQVYADVQALLDGAIADLQSGQGIGPAEFDLNFGGDPAAWERVAHSLKARYHMHLAELDPAQYQAAIQEAQAGISSVAGNWQAVHNEILTESNVWFQFTTDRSGYISAGGFLVDTLLQAGTETVVTDDDPRLGIYFTTGSGDFEGVYIGSPPGTDGPGNNQPGALASQLNVPGAASFDMPIVSCAETQFIIAEAAVATSNAGLAQTAANAAIACEEVFWGITLTPFAASPTLEQVMTQKYISGFLKIEAYNDYKRTCFPAIHTFNNLTIPPRLFYPSSERQSNPNIPPPNLNRNDNDPQPCPPR